MRQQHRAGEKAFVDFAGHTQGVVDPASGEIWQAPVFCSCLGASSYTYAEALPRADLASFLLAHVHTCSASLWGRRQVINLDNPSWKDAVSKACFYEPEINPSYLDLARHYGCAILPTRVARPRDKACASDCSSFEVSGTKSSSELLAVHAAPSSWSACRAALFRLL